MRKVGCLLLVAALWFALFLGTAWATGALYFAFPWPLLRPYVAAVYGLAMIAAFMGVKRRGRAVGLVLLGLVLVLGWWSTIKPSNDRPWQPNVAQTAYADIHGDQVILHNVRDFEYRTETDYTPHWITRSVRLSQLTGVDFSLIYWGSPWIAHVIVSFRFADAPPIAFSIETRQQIGQQYSTLAGIFRRYTLIYIVAEERDVIRLRTNYRKDEEVYLFHLKVAPARARAIFLDYLASLNALREHPQFYNALTSNCTTNVRIHVVSTEKGKTPSWNWRLLLNGKLDELVYARGALDSSLPLPELKRRSWINPAAHTMNDAPDFSQRIRAGLPGF